MGTRSVNFDGSASIDIDGIIVSYEWNFGDGGSADGASPNHTYILLEMSNEK
jgi:PKD repeat protein